MTIYKLLICGSRYSTPHRAIRRVIKDRKEMCERRTFELVVIEGGAPGVDRTAKIEAERENVHVAEVEALWTTRGNSAGPQRNRIMLALEPHEVVGFHKEIEKSKGTKHMLKLATDKGIKNSLVDEF